MKRLLSALLVCGCAHALGPPPRLEDVAPAPGGEASALLRDADEAWSRRAADDAERLYLQAARAAPRDPAAWAGAIRAKAFRLGHASDRARIAGEAVQLGQLCEQNAPSAPLCDFWLAAALGLQARERSATGRDALPRMVELLRRAAAHDASVERGGPHRLLAILLLRAPGWPLGPGDVEAALPEAQAAVQLDAAYPPNLLTLAEALRRNGRAAEAKARYAEALRLAEASSDPEAGGWAADARAALH